MKGGAFRTPRGPAPLCFLPPPQQLEQSVLQMGLLSPCHRWALTAPPAFVSQESAQVSGQGEGVGTGAGQRGAQQPDSVSAEPAWTQGPGGESRVAAGTSREDESVRQVSGQDRQPRWASSPA